MAINVRPINIKFPPKRTSFGVFATNNTTIDAVTDNLKILILTNHGERPCQYDFGANLRSALFNQGEDLSERVKDLIITAISKWMPFVILNEVSVDTQDTNDTLKDHECRITIKFSVGKLEGKLTQVVNL